jgi:hypothetical protein
METYTEQPQTELSGLLERAARDGEVRIQRTDGTVFILQPQDRLPSPLDVAGIDLPVSTEEIIEIIREGRERKDVLHLE